MTHTEAKSDTERFESALHASSPVTAVRTVVLELSAEGFDKPEIYARLERFLLDRRLRDEHSESDEDALLDAMDAVAGWCHPTAQLQIDQRHT